MATEAESCQLYIHRWHMIYYCAEGMLEEIVVRTKKESRIEIFRLRSRNPQRITSINLPYGLDSRWRMIGRNRGQIVLLSTCSKGRVERLLPRAQKLLLQSRTQRQGVPRVCPLDPHGTTPTDWVRLMHIALRQLYREPLPVCQNNFFARNSNNPHTQKAQESIVRVPEYHSPVMMSSSKV